jgi:hypothetical protein
MRYNDFPHSTMKERLPGAAAWPADRGIGAVPESLDGRADRQLGRHGERHHGLHHHHLAVLATWVYWVRLFRPLDACPLGAEPAGRGVAFLITAWQLRHSNVSKSSRFSRDLLACMAIPQTGQGRMLGRRYGFIDKPSPNTADRLLIQINANCGRLE